MAVTRQQVAELYVATFNRAPDAAGLDYWVNDSGLTIEEIAQSFFDQPETTTKYPLGTTDAAFVEAIYLNLFNRAPDADGLAYWVAKLTATETVPAEMTRDVMIEAMKNGAIALGGTDATIIANKATVGIAYADAGLEGTDFSLASVTEVQSTVDAALADVADLAPQALALTTATDAITGASGDDTISGTVSGLVSANTLQVTDTIDGAEGTDTLKVSVNSDFAGFTTGSVKNVETVELTNISSTARNFDASGITGVAKYVINANDAGINLSDLAANADIELNNLNATVNFTTAFGASATEVTGTTDTMKFKINSVGIADDAATAASEEKVVTATLTDIETVTLTVEGTNVISFGGTDLKAINVSGSGSLKVNAVTTSLTSFDASGATGAIDVDTTAAAANALTKVATGSADDKITLDTGDILANGTISGGSGSDTLTLNSAAKTVQYTMTGIETLALNTISGPVTFSGSNVSDLTTVTSVAATAGVVSFVNMGSQDLTITSKGATVDTGDISSDHSGATTINYTALPADVTTKTVRNALAEITADSATGSLTVNVNEYMDTTTSDISAAKASSVTLNVASGKDSSATPVEVTEFDSVLTAAKATSVTVNATGKLGTNADVVAAAATSAVITNGSTAGQLSYIGAKTTDLTLKSGAAFTMTGSTLTGVQNATLTMDKGALTAVGDLAAAASVTLAGADTTSAITLGALGAVTNDYGLTLTATGLKAGLTATTLNVNAGYDINVDVKGVTGFVSLGAVGTAAKAKNITVDAQGVDGAFTVGAVTGTGDVIVKLDGIGGVVTLGTLTGKTVNVDASDTIGGVATTTYTVVAKDSATVAVSSLEASTVNIDAGTDSTALTVSLTGGIGVDAIDIDTVTTSTSVVVTGDLNLGTDTVDLTDTTYATAAATMTKDISGLLNYATATITGKDAFKDTIKGGAGVDTIKGGTGVDTITGGAGADVFIFGALDAIAGTELDVITDFNAGGTGDIIQLTLAGTPVVLAAEANGTTATTDVDTTAGGLITFAAADDTYAKKVVAIQADSELDVAKSIAFFEDSGNTYVYFAGAAIGGLDDQIIQLTGVTGLTTITVTGTTDITIA